jgi:hypothetical protein
MKETISQNEPISGELSVYTQKGTNTVKTIIAGYDLTNEVIHIFKANY